MKKEATGTSIFPNQAVIKCTEMLARLLLWAPHVLLRLVASVQGDHPEQVLPVGRH